MASSVPSSGVSVIPTQFGEEAIAEVAKNDPIFKNSLDDFCNALGEAIVMERVFVSWEASAHVPILLPLIKELQTNQAEFEANYDLLEKHGGENFRDLKRTNEIVSHGNELRKVQTKLLKKFTTYGRNLLDKFFCQDKNNGEEAGKAMLQQILAELGITDEPLATRLNRAWNDLHVSYDLLSYDSESGSDSPI